MGKIWGGSAGVVLFGAAAFFVCLFGAASSECFDFREDPSPAATVIDDETGRPIEGAVALAVWRKHSSTARAWWEGGTDVVVRIEEAVSDKDGNIFIEDFWNRHLFESGYPHLTVYKFGYVCWDQGQIYLDALHTLKRTDFNKDNRIARMKKWPEGFSFNSHESFVYGVTQGAYNESSKHLFRDAFHHEIPLSSKERDQEYQKKK